MTTVRVCPGAAHYAPNSGGHPTTDPVPVDRASPAPVQMTGAGPVPVP